MFRTPIGRLRAIGIYEGVSFLMLLLIAMPLKYYAGIPQLVRWIGSLHGLLFVLYLLAVLHVTIVHRWSILRVLVAVIASLLPFGTFVLDARLRKEQ